MTDEGGRILEAIRQVRRLHEDISLLLRTADAAMDESGWKNAKSDSTALHEMSWGIDKPRQWMPWEVFRHYRHEDRRGALAAIAVLLDDGQKTIPEPLVTGTYVEFGDNYAAGKHPNWIGALFKATLGNEADGQFFEVRRQQLNKDWDFSFQTAWCFARPLVTVTSEEFLRQEIVGKFLSQIEILTPQ